MAAIASRIPVDVLRQKKQRRRRRSGRQRKFPEFQAPHGSCAKSGLAWLFPAVSLASLALVSSANLSDRPHVSCQPRGLRVPRLIGLSRRLRSRRPVQLRLVRSRSSWSCTIVHCPYASQRVGTNGSTAGRGWPPLPSSRGSRRHHTSESKRCLSRVSAWIDSMQSVNSDWISHGRREGLVPRGLLPARIRGDR